MRGAVNGELQHTSRAEKSVQKRFIDELDATNAGMTWLRKTAGPLGAERIDTLSGEGSGGVCSAWKGNELLAYFVVVRDLLNWSIVVTHDLSEERRATEERWTAERPDSQFSLPYDVDVTVCGLDVSIESQLARELASSSPESPVEIARTVGVVEGIEHLLMSLARAGVDLAELGIAEALEDCVLRLKS
jgi:hypothetical protein